MELSSGSSRKSEKKLRKVYRSIIENECIPLSEVPRDIQDRYSSEYLFRDRIIDFSFLAAIKNYSTGAPLNSPEVQELFTEIRMLREARRISAACSLREMTPGAASRQAA